MISLEGGQGNPGTSYICTPHFRDGRVGLIGRHASLPEIRSVEK
jgi:hypothetical protein